jgi:hypothetical protein
MASFTIADYSFNATLFSRDVTVTDATTGLVTTTKNIDFSAPGVALGLLGGSFWKATSMEREIVNRGGSPMHTSAFKKALPWVSGV